MPSNRRSDPLAESNSRPRWVWICAGSNGRCDLNTVVTGGAGYVGDLRGSLGGARADVLGGADFVEGDARDHRYAEKRFPLVRPVKEVFLESS